MIDAALPDRLTFGRTVVAYDAAATRSLYRSGAISFWCQCLGCENFRRLTKECFPQRTGEFLRSLGIDPHEPEHRTGRLRGGTFVYTGYYLLIGALTAGDRSGVRVLDPGVAVWFTTKDRPGDYTQLSMSPEQIAGLGGKDRGGPLLALQFSMPSVWVNPPEEAIVLPWLRGAVPTTIEAATKADVPSMTALRCASVAAGGSRRLSDEIRKRWDDVWLREQWMRWSREDPQIPPNGECLIEEFEETVRHAREPIVVARRNGAVVGYAGIDPEKRQVALLSVAPDELGAGDALLANGEGRARALELPYLDVIAPPSAERFFVNLGYHAVGAENFPLQYRRTEPVVRMRKTL